MDQKYYYMVSSLKEENWTLKEAFVRFADKNQKYSNIVVESLQRAMTALEEEKRLKDSTIREMEENLLCDERDQLQENCQSRIQGALKDTNMDQDQFNQRYMTLGTMDSGLLDGVDTMEELEGRTQDLEMDLREDMEENLLCKERNLRRQAESQSRILESLNDANMDLEALNHRMKILGAMNSRLHDDDDEDIEEELQTQDQELFLSLTGSLAPPGGSAGRKASMTTESSVRLSTVWK
uniref:Uncharacterized protein n=1 Tax=Knipowitschia caucasica TaxID=637954 RepID=A0AAV2JB53_KNICA